MALVRAPRLELPDGAVVLACWHRDLLPMYAVARHIPSLALVSQSRDADFLCALLASTAVRTVRGSSSRGAQASRGLLRHLRNGGVVIMALDGPKGPAGQEKPGAAWLAEQSGARLIRLDFEVSRCLKLNDWSGLRIPLPASRVQVRLGSIFGGK
jgi:lysophospholipid acyltransferase (LPLAT)-like uncharacterized protein